jgi:hypothetical protein
MPILEGEIPICWKYLGSRISSEKLRKKKKWAVSRMRRSRVNLRTNDPVYELVKALKRVVKPRALAPPDMICLKPGHSRDLTVEADVVSRMDNFAGYL